LAPFCLGPSLSRKGHFSTTVCFSFATTPMYSGKSENPNCLATLSSCQYLLIQIVYGTQGYAPVEDGVIGCYGVTGKREHDYTRVIATGWAVIRGNKLEQSLCREASDFRFSHPILVSRILIHNIHEKGNEGCMTVDRGRPKQW
jgi:hypothetical protein